MISASCKAGCETKRSALVAGLVYKCTMTAPLPKKHTRLDYDSSEEHANTVNASSKGERTTKYAGSGYKECYAPCTNSPLKHASNNVSVIEHAVVGSLDLRARFEITLNGVRMWSMQVFQQPRVSAISTAETVGQTPQHSMESSKPSSVDTKLVFCFDRRFWNGLDWCSPVSEPSWCVSARAVTLHCSL
jgi:hypothetical protein